VVKFCSRVRKLNGLSRDATKILANFSDPYTPDVSTAARDATVAYTVDGQMRHRFIILGVYCRWAGTFILMT